MVKQTMIDLPIADDGLPDVQRQRAVADRIASLKRDKAWIEESLRQLAGAEVLVPGLLPADTD